MAKDKTTVKSPEPGVGTPPDQRGNDRDLDILQTEVTKIQVDGEYTKKFLGELQTDMRDMRERVAKLEVKVDHLPSKGFTVVVVTTIFLIANGAFLLLSKFLSATGH